MTSVGAHPIAPTSEPLTGVEGSRPRGGDMELRIHGVGGADARSSMLRPKPAEGEPDRSPEPGRLIWADWWSERAARSTVRGSDADPTLRLYHWAPLTSGSRWFALWPILLPFTLINAAAWMAPRGWRAHPHRVVVAALGVLATASTALWLSWLADIAVVAWLEHASRTQARWIGHLGSAAAIGAIALISTYTAKGFDRWRPAQPLDGARGDRKKIGRWTLRHLKRLVGAGGDRKKIGRWTLGHPKRFAGGWPRAIPLAIHLAIAATAWACARQLDLPALPDASAHAWLHPASLRASVLLGQLVLVAALLISGGLGAGTAALGSALIPGLTLSAGLLLFGDAAPVEDASMAVLHGIGLGLWLGAAGLVITAIRRLATPSRGDEDLRAARATADPKRIEAARRKIGTVPALVAARAATIPAELRGAVTLLAIGVVAGSIRTDLWRQAQGEAPTWRLTTTVTVVSARAVLVFLVAKIAWDIWRRWAPEADRNRVGVLWDVLTLWPRSFHPFAIRPYGERAVPELQAYVTRPGRGDLTVVAHSQGSLLALAALSPLPATSLRGLRLVTMGSPISTLYQRYFPAAIPPALLEQLRERLVDANGDWRHAYRHTDYVGRALDLDGIEQTVLDEPPGPGEPLGAHGGYWRDAAFEALVSTPTTDPSTTPRNGGAS